MIYKTVGIGGDYTDWFAFTEWACSLLLFEDDWTVTQISDCTLSGDMAALKIRNGVHHIPRNMNLNGHSLYVTSDSDPLGDLNGGYKTYLSGGNDTFYLAAWYSSYYRGNIYVSKLNISTLPGTDAANRLWINALDTIIEKCIVVGVDNINEVGIYKDTYPDPYKLHNIKIYNCRTGIHKNSSGTVSAIATPGIRFMENISVYGGRFGYRHTYQGYAAGANECWSIKNIACAGQSAPGVDPHYAFYMTDSQPTNVMSHCGDDDGSQPTFATDRQESIVVADEFISLDPASSNFLKPKVGGSIYDGGTVPTYVTEDLTGLPIPSYVKINGEYVIGPNYPVGCHNGALVLSDIGLPQEYIDDGIVVVSGLGNGISDPTVRINIACDADAEPLIGVAPHKLRCSAFESITAGIV